MLPDGGHANLIRGARAPCGETYREVSCMSVERSTSRRGSLPARTAATAATTTAATTTAASSGRIFSRPRLVHREHASLEVLAVQRLDGSLCLRIGRHFYKAETL